MFAQICSNDYIKLTYTFLWQDQFFPGFHKGKFMEVVEDMEAKVNKKQLNKWVHKHFLQYRLSSFFGL